MDRSTIRQRLSELSSANLLSQFAKKSGIGRRTLNRLIADEKMASEPHPITLIAIERTLALKQFLINEVR